VHVVDKKPTPKVNVQFSGEQLDHMHALVVELQAQVLGAGNPNTHKVRQLLAELEDLTGDS
jgi:hypothetical protein